MKRYLKFICIFMIFVILLNVIFVEKVKAITVTAALGGVVFASLLLASGIKFLNTGSLDKLYNKWLEIKPADVNWSDFVMSAVTTSFMTGKFAFDKASDVVSGVVDFIKDKINVAAGEATVDLEAGSYYTDDLSISNVSFNKIKGKTLVFYVGKYKFLFRRYDKGYSLFANNIDDWSEIVHVKVSYNDYDLDRADAVYITHFNIVEHCDDVTGDVDYIDVSVGLKVRLNYGDGYEWTDYKEVENKRITSRHLGIPSVVDPGNLVNLYVDDYSVVSGGDIRENIVNPILPYSLDVGVKEGIYTRKGNEITYNGDVDSLVTDLDNLGVLDDIVNKLVNKSYSDVNSIPAVQVSEGEGVLTLPYVDVGDISDPSVPVPAIPDDMFEPGQKTIDWGPLLNIDISEKFPFCLPYDFKRGVETLVKPAQIPKWELPILGEKIDIDFEQFEELAKISRYFFTLIYICTLILVTKRLMGGQ